MKVFILIAVGYALACAIVWACGQLGKQKLKPGWRVYQDPTYPRNGFIFARKRKLSVRWSLEAAEELRDLWGNDIEKELITKMEEEMHREGEREVIIYLIVDSIIRDVFGDPLPSERP